MKLLTNYAYKYLFFITKSPCRLVVCTLSASKLSKTKCLILDLACLGSSMVDLVDKKDQNQKLWLFVL